MSKKNEQRITEDERQKLAAAREALENANMKLKRAQVTNAVCQTTLDELMLGIQRRYKMKEGDAIDALTGAITRK